MRRLLDANKGRDILRCKYVSVILQHVPLSGHFGPELSNEEIKKNNNQRTDSSHFIWLVLSQTFGFVCKCTQLTWYPYLIYALVYLQRFGQNICLFLDLIAEVVTDTTELDTFGSDGVHSIVIALNQLVTMQCVKLCLFQCGLEENQLNMIH